MSRRGGSPVLARLLPPVLLLLPLAPLRAQVPASALVETAVVLRLVGDGRMEEAESRRRMAAAAGLDTADMDAVLGAAFIEGRDYAKALRYLESAWPRLRSRTLAGSAALAAFLAEAWDKAERYARLLREEFREVEDSSEILGSIALIRDDLPLALHYWNVIGKPVLFDIVVTPAAEAAALVRAAPVAKGRIFRVGDWFAAEDFLARLPFLRNRSLLLMPREDGLYDLQVRVDLKKPFYENPGDFLVSEAFHVLQSQVSLAWNRIGGTRNSLGGLYRYQDDRKGLALSWVHSLAFGADVDLRLAYLSRDETWFPGSDAAASFRQNVLRAEAAGRLLGGENDRLGLFYKAYAEPGQAERRYLGGTLGKRLRLAGSPRSLFAAALEAEVEGELSAPRERNAQAFGSLSLGLSARAGLPVGALKADLTYARSWLPDRSDYWLLGVGPGFRHLMRAHAYRLNRADGAEESLYSKHFLLGNVQLEIDLTPRSLIDLKAAVFWDCYRPLDRGSSRPAGTVNDVGLALDAGFLGKGVASLCLGYNIEKKAFAIYLGPSWGWD